MQIPCVAHLIICKCNLLNVSNKFIHVFILQFAAEGVDTCLHLKFLTIYFGDVPNVPFMSSVKPSLTGPPIKWTPASASPELFCKTNFASLCKTWVIQSRVISQLTPPEIFGNALIFYPLGPSEKEPKIRVLNN